MNTTHHRRSKPPMEWTLNFLSFEHVVIMIVVVIVIVVLIITDSTNSKNSNNSNELNFENGCECGYIQEHHWYTPAAWRAMDSRTSPNLKMDMLPTCHNPTHTRFKKAAKSLTRTYSTPT